MIVPNQRLIAATAFIAFALSGSALASEKPGTAEKRGALSMSQGASLPSGLVNLAHLASLNPPIGALRGTAASAPQAPQAPTIRLASLAPLAPLTSLASLTSLAPLPNEPLMDRPRKAPRPACVISQTPPAALATRSKFDQSDRSRSTIDTTASAERQRLIQPIRQSVRMVTKIAHAASDSELLRQARANCVLENLDHWAKARALTDMKTPDAVLTRDRWVAEVVLALSAASATVEISADRRALYSAWLMDIAASTMDAYTHRLGPKSRSNNHRYWAGLAVAAIGVFVGDDRLNDWAAQSFAIGACQVDRHGLLPLELARGSLALNYHVYALRPLAAIVRLKEKGAFSKELPCLAGFARLQNSVQSALSDKRQFEQVAGVRQSVKNDERSFSKALQRQELGI